MIRVVVVDDQPVVRAGLARLLSPPDGFDLVAECGDGITATARICRLPDPAAVMILTTFDDDEALWGAVEAGAAGFVLKDAPAETLLAAAKAVAAGAAWLDPQVAPRALHAFRRVAGGRRDSGAISRLTERESVVLRLVARGATNAEIAAGLHLSEATVKTHIGSIFAKLGARDRAAAIVFAYDHGLVRANEDVAPAHPVGATRHPRSPSTAS